MDDIKSEAIKKVYGSNWKFTFLNSGWVALSVISYDKKNNVSWSTQIKAIDLGSVLQYLWTTENKRGDPLVFEELEDA